MECYSSPILGNLRVFKRCQYKKTILRKKNMGQILFKKHSKLQNFDEIFYCGMTRPKNTSLDVFIQCHSTKTILRKKNIGQNLFKKHSEFQNYDEIFYCGITRLRNLIFNYYGLCRFVKAVKPKKVVRQSIQNFKISIFNKVFYCNIVKRGHN